MLIMVWNFIIQDISEVVLKNLLSQNIGVEMSIMIYLFMI